MSKERKQLVCSVHHLLKATEKRQGEKVFVKLFTQKTETARARGRKDESKSKMKYSCKYYLKKSGTNLRVCKTMFQNTLSIGEWMAFQWQDEKNEETIVGG